MFQIFNFFFLKASILSLFKLKIGCVDTIEFNSLSTNIFAEFTILSFFLNNGYCEIFLIPEKFAKKIISKRTTENKNFIKVSRFNFFSKP